MRLFAALLLVVVSVVSAEADITIGVNLSTTGPAAAMGIGMKNAMAMAPQSIAGQKINYIILTFIFNIINFHSHCCNVFIFENLRF